MPKKGPYPGEPDYDGLQATIALAVWTMTFDKRMPLPITSTQVAEFLSRFTPPLNLDVHSVTHELIRLNDNPHGTHFMYDRVGPTEIEINRVLPSVGTVFDPEFGTKPLG